MSRYEATAKGKARKARFLAANPGYMKAAQARYSARHPDRVKATNDARDPIATLDQYRRRRYGITSDDYDRMRDEQGGVCAICRRECSTGMRLAVDHCHATKRVRGLLCNACNLSLGKMGDDPTRLRAAADYLERT